MDKVKNSRNRLTPILIVILICLVWVFAVEIIYKVYKSNKLKNVTKIKLDDALVQELYQDITDDDILLYSSKDYDTKNLPINNIFAKSIKNLTIEDIEFEGNNFKISYEALDSAISRAYGPDFKYDLSKINGVIKTNFKKDALNVTFDVKYDPNLEQYIGTYKNTDETDKILVKKELVQAYKNNNIYLKVGYVIYKNENNKYQICKDNTCNSIEKEIDSIDNYEYKNFVTIELEIASDDIYYFKSSSRK